MIIEELGSKKDELAWDDFVTKNSSATFYHQIGWKTLVEKCYKFRPIYLMAKDGGEVNGILPLFLVKNMFSGRRLISVPFSTVGGVCANNAIATNVLIDKAIELTKSLNCKYLELRNLKQEDRGDLINGGTYYTFRLKLNSDPQILWQNLGHDNRKLIRRAKKTNLQVILESKDFQKFYAIFSKGQRNLGTPIQDHKWLENLFFDFPNNHSIAMVEYNGKTVSVQFLRYFKNTVSGVFAYSLEEYRGLRPNHVMLWELIENACRKGYEIFDFGRSVEKSGTFAFKLGWRAEPIKLSYQYYLNNIKSVPDTSQANRRRQLFATIWKKVPLAVTNVLGPVIRRRYP